MRIFQPARSKFSNRDVHLSLLLGGLLNDSDNTYQGKILPTKIFSSKICLEHSIFQSILGSLLKKEN